MKKLVSSWATKRCLRPRSVLCLVTVSAPGVSRDITLRLLISFGCESTRNMLVFSPCSTVSGGSETWLFMTTRDRFLARTRNELSRRPANIYELSAQTLTRGGRRAEGTADSSSDPRRVLLRMTTVQRIPGNGE